MKTLRVQNIISLTTCFFLILAVTICKETSSEAFSPIREMQQKTL